MISLLEGVSFEQLRIVPETLAAAPPALGWLFSLGRRRSRSVHTGRAVSFRPSLENPHPRHFGFANSTRVEETEASCLEVFKARLNRIDV